MKSTSMHFVTVLLASLAWICGCDESALSTHSADGQAHRQGGPPPPPPPAQAEDGPPSRSSNEPVAEREVSRHPSTTDSQVTGHAAPNSSPDSSPTDADAGDRSADVPRGSKATDLPRSDSDDRAGLRVDLFGVALAQTLPTGSAMGFSVEYQVLAGRLDPSAKYAWVIEHPQGQVWRHQVNLDSRGELATFVTEWPPFNGTYTTYLEEHRGSQSVRVVSKRLPLVYAY